jgi:DNA-binding LacI/PurR family transcriptional regulator
MVTTFKPTNEQPMPRQIAVHLRQLIRSGRWPEGMRLPATTELAVQLDTDPATMHRALALLNKEGLLDRRQRAGTFVRQSRPVLTAVGVYMSINQLGAYGSPFLQALSEALRTELTGAGLETQFFLDTRAEAEVETPWPQLVEAVEKHQIQALVLPTSNPVIVRWIYALNVPVAELSSATCSTLGMDNGGFAESSIQALADQGCRGAGLIAPHAKHTGSMAQNFVDAARDRGMAIRDEWMVWGQDYHGKQISRAHQEFGYQAMRQIWEQPERPDGLIVYPDSIAAGVIVALLEARVRVPEQLRLVMQRNRGLPLLCPFPATYIEADPAEAASVLARQVCDLADGKSVEHMNLTYRVIQSRPSG